MPGNRLFKLFTYKLLKLQKLAIRYSRLTFIFGIVLFLVGGFLAKDQKFLILIEDLIDEDFTTYSQLRHLNEEFDDRNNLNLFIRNTPGITPTKEMICDLRAWIQQLVGKRYDIKSVYSSFGLLNITQGSDEKMQFDYLLDPDCGNLADPQAEYIEQSLKKISESPWGIFLSGKEDRELVVSFYLRNTLENSPFGAFDTRIVDDIKDDFASNFLTKYKDLDFTWAGIASYMNYLRTGYDVSILINMLSGGFVVFLFFLIFGNLRSGLLFLFTYNLTMIPTMGFMAFFGHPIDSLSNALPIMVLLASVEDFLFLSFIQKKYPNNWRYPFKKILFPGFLTSITTVIGFGSLIAADIGIIRRFGGWAAFASLLEFFIHFIWLPAMLNLFPKWRIWTGDKDIRGMKLFYLFEKKTLKPSMGRVLILVVFSSPFFISKLNYSDAPERIFPESHVLRKSVKKLKESKGWSSSFSLIFHDYDKRDENQNTLNQLSKDSLVSGFESPYQMEKYLKKEVEVDLKSLVTSMWEKSRFGKRLVGDGSYEGRAIIYINDTDIVQINRLRSVVSNLCGKSCTMSGILVSYAELGSRVMNSFLSSMFSSVLLITLFIIFIGTMERGLRSSLALALSAMFGPLALLGVFILFKVPVFFVTSIIISILVGLAGDNAIQFLFFGQRELGDSVGQISKGSIIVYFFMVAISSLLLFSYFGALRLLALLMISGLTLSTFGDIWILKSLIRSK
jgi:predicted RND superfamily exporter protein